jgi:hypothetical protein
MFDTAGMLTKISLRLYLVLFQKLRIACMLSSFIVSAAKLAEFSLDTAIEGSTMPVDIHKTTFGHIPEDVFHTVELKLLAQKQYFIYIIWSISVPNLKCLAGVADLLSLLNRKEQIIFSWPSLEQEEEKKPTDDTYYICLPN